MTDIPSLEADCANCAALCCMAPAFDVSPQFAIDKPAATPCPNLGPGHSCRIHARLTQEGFEGCVRYTCHGAGQRVTQALFGGRSWQDLPELMRPMTEAFLVMRRVHDLLLLLAEAGKLPLAAASRERYETLLQELNPEPGWTQSSLAALDITAQEQTVHAFLRSLRAEVA